MSPGRSPIEGEILGVRGIASTLGVSERTAIRYTKLAAFPMPVVEVGGRRLWLKADIREWFDNSRPKLGRPPLR